jgi:hypothetical protein
MRKRATLFLAVLTVGILAYGAIGSAAWFTDSDSVAVTATSGVVDIEGNPVSFTADDLMPGVWSAPTEITIYNTGNSTTAVKFRITDQFGTESYAGFYDQIWVRLNQRFCGGIESTQVYEGLLKDLEHTNASATNPNWTAGLPINITACYYVRFALASTAGNVFQNRTATFDLVIDATQPENPGWAQ